MSRYVARRRVELGLDRVQVVVLPQTHPPGAEAEVDFGEFYATVELTHYPMTRFPAAVSELVWASRACRCRPDQLPRHARRRSHR